MKAKNKIFKYNLATFVLLLVIVFGVTNCSEQRIDGVRTGTVNGIVVENGTNTPIANVKITTNPSSTTVFTNEQGRFSLKEILVNKYTVQAELTGYNEEFEAVTLTEGSVVDVAFELSDKKSLNDPPSAPKLAFPADKAKNISTNEIVFTWEAKDPNPKDILTYTFEIRNGKTNEVQFFEKLKDTFYVLKDLKLASTYFWEIKASDDINEPVSSSISEFTTVEYPNNPIVFVKKEGENTVLYSGKKAVNQNEDEPQVDVDLLKLTASNANSFKPKGNKIAKKVAYLRSVGGDTHIFTIDTNGTNEKQITSSVPVNGFRLGEVNFCWAGKGKYLYYPSFSKLYRVDPDGGGTQKIYETSDGSFISEVAVSDFNSDLVVLKTNDFKGYNVRIVTVSLSTGTEQNVIVEGVSGAFGGVGITANGDKVIYTRDLSGSENDDYRLFESRIFIHTIATNIAVQVNTSTSSGYNILDVSYTPSEGAVVYTKVLNYFGAIPEVAYLPLTDDNEDEIKLFTSASMPNWD